MRMRLPVAIFLTLIVLASVLDAAATAVASTESPSTETPALPPRNVKQQPAAPTEKKTNQTPPANKLKAATTKADAAQPQVQAQGKQKTDSKSSFASLLDFFAPLALLGSWIAAAFSIFLSYFDDTPAAAAKVDPESQSKKKADNKSTWKQVLDISVGIMAACVLFFILRRMWGYVAAASMGVGLLGGAIAGIMVYIDEPAMEQKVKEAAAMEQRKAAAQSETTESSKQPAKTETANPTPKVTPVKKGNPQANWKDQPTSN